MANNTKSYLQDRKVILKPIVKQGGMNPKGHDGEFMYTGTEVDFVLPYNINKGRLESILTPDEQKYFEELLDEDLSIHKKVDNYWYKFGIKVRKDDNLMQRGYELDLNDPIDYLRWKLLQVQPIVAPSWEARNDKGEYRFALVDEAQLNEAKSQRADRKKEAYMFLGSIENSRSKMYDFLRVMGKKPSPTATPEFLKGAIDDLIENPKTLSEVLAVIHDENYDMKLFVEDAVEVGAIEKRQRKYYLPGGDPINPADPTLNGTIAVLKEYKRDTDDIYLKILTQINESK